MIHGSYNTFNRLKCRCDSCTEAHRDHHKTQRQRGAAFLDLTREQRRSCLICGTALNVHAFKACWREVR